MDHEADEDYPALDVAADIGYLDSSAATTGMHRRRPLKRKVGGRSTNNTGGSMSSTGRCFCGKVRYQIDRSLGPGRSCHCSRCRKAFSSAGSAYADIIPDSFSWLEGQENLSFYETAPGWGLCFCRTCGSTLCGTFEGSVHGVTLGSIDGDPGIEIEMHIFVGSKASWDHIGGQAPQYSELPPQTLSK